MKDELEKDVQVADILSSITMGVLIVFAKFGGYEGIATKIIGVLGITGIVLSLIVIAMLTVLRFKVPKEVISNMLSKKSYMLKFRIVHVIGIVNMVLMLIFSYRELFLIFTIYWCITVYAYKVVAKEIQEHKNKCN